MIDGDGIGIDGELSAAGAGVKPGFEANAFGAGGAEPF